MIRDTRLSYIEVAKNIGADWAIARRDVTKINAYTEAYIAATEESSPKAEWYISALMIYYIDKFVKNFYDSNRNLFGSADDVVEIIYDGIRRALKGKAWRNPEKHTNADACITRGIQSELKQRRLDANMDKRKLNYGNISLEATLDSSEESKNTVLDTLVDTKALRKNKSDEAAVSFIQSFIADNKLTEAIILDVIAFNNLERVERIKHTVTREDGSEYKYVESKSTFWEHACIDMLSHLPVSYNKYFSEKYGLDLKMSTAAVDTIRVTKSPKLYKYLRATLSTAKRTITELN